MAEANAIGGGSDAAGRRWPVLARLGAGLLVAAAALLVARAIAAPGSAWLSARAPAAWIRYPSPPDVMPRPAVALDAVFRRSFLLEAAPPAALLRARVLGEGRAVLNGRPLALSPEGVEVAGLLVPGRNSLEVSVENEAGPPALWLALDLPRGPLVSDGSWDVSLAGASWRPAAHAEAPSAGPAPGPGAPDCRPLRGIADTWPLVAVFALFSAGLYLLGTRSGHWPRPAAGLLMEFIGLLWVLLLVSNLPAAGQWTGTGFDAPEHRRYVQHILDRHALPLADEGWQMYQPPLYYAVAAAAFAVAGVSTADAEAPLIFALLGLACGVATLRFARSGLRLLYPKHPRRQVLGFLVAAAFPGLIAACHFPGNEPLLAALSAAAIAATLRVLGAERPTVRAHLLLGAVLGLALLTKLTALVLVPFTLGILALRLPARPREARRREVVGLAAAALAMLAVCGWHYGRVWSHFGTPFVGNWDVAAGLPWWQDPGFRAVGHFLRFGRGLTDPLFAGFSSVPDGLFTTAWGDGLLSGAGGAVYAPPWRYPLMGAGYLLALVPAAAILLGAGAALVAWLRHPRATGALLLGFPFAVLASLVAMAIRVPSYAQAKATYALAALLPLAAFSGIGLDLAMGRLLARRALVAAAVGAFALAAAGAFFADSRSARALTAEGAQALERGERVAGVSRLRMALKTEPTYLPARLMLADALVEDRADPAEIERLLDPGACGGDSAARRLVRASLLDALGRRREALEETRLALGLDPDSLRGHVTAASLLSAEGDASGAAAEWREVLRITPHSAPAHEEIAKVCARLGLPEEAAAHRGRAARITAWVRTLDARGGLGR